MGVYSEYIEKNWGFDEVGAERKLQLARISELRGRDVLVYAADFDKGAAPISLDYSDLVPVQDQLSNLHGTKLDVILETPGGSGEVAEDIVKLLHGQFEEVGFIIPAWAKSAGTILAMAGDDILMEPSSALGPIDAQLSYQGKQFSADALLEGFEKIKEEVDRVGSLNRAYVPILQGISPGELQSAENALAFAKVLVADWLATYKFKNWRLHSSTGIEVTDEDRRSRADEIATKLCNHRSWLTHGRSIKINDLEEMKLKITDYSDDPPLWDAIRRYHTLLRMTFSSNVYKVFETPTSQILRFVAAQPTQGTPPDANSAAVQVQCPRCQSTHNVQANLGAHQPLTPGALPWPHGDRLSCPQCGNELDLTDARRQIEGATGKKVVAG